MGLTLTELLTIDSELFSGASYPDFEWSKVNTNRPLTREEFFDYLVAEAGHFETYYPDPAGFKKHFNLWTNKHCGRWAELFRTTQFEYDPISNYNRREEWSDVADHKSTTTSNVTEKVAAYDTDEMTPRNNSGGTASGSGTQTSKRTGRLSGNIGVTTTQEMIGAEREVLMFDVFDTIVQEYKKRFCILVY